MGIPGVYQGGYTGWVVGGAIPGYYPAARGEVLRPAERARRPCRGRSGGSQELGRTGRLDGLLTHPAGPVGPCGPSLVRTPWNAAPGPIRRDLTSYLRNLVKTAECHQNMSIRPVIVPVPKTAIKSHLLIFWDFCFPQPSLTRN